MNNQVVMDKFFTLHKSELDKFGVMNKPNHIFNADESGVDVNAHENSFCSSLKFCMQGFHFFRKLPRTCIFFFT